MRNPKKLVGVTLVEVMVALFVASILMTVLIRMFTVSTKTGTEELARASTEATALYLVTSVERDLQNSSPAGVTLVPSGAMLAVHPVESVLDTRQVVYRNQLILWEYLPDDKLVKRTVSDDWFSTFDLRPHRLDDTELSALQANPQGKLALKIGKVKDFSVSNPGDVEVPSVGAPLTISVTILIEEASTRKEVTFEKSIWIRSSGT